MKFETEVPEQTEVILCKTMPSTDGWSEIWNKIHTDANMIKNADDILQMTWLVLCHQ